jgi:hypothetical protein
LDAALLAAYSLKELEVQFLLPGRFEPAPVDIRSFEVRWSTETGSATRG